MRLPSLLRILALAAVAGSCMPQPTPSIEEGGRTPTVPLPAPSVIVSETPPQGPASSTSTESAPSEVSIPATDGLEIRGTFTPGRPADGSAVLLLHMYGADRSTWSPFADSLAIQGISSLAIDLRGHGQTGGAEDWTLSRSDVAVAFEWLGAQPGIDPDRLGMVGASIGANLALVQAASNPASVSAIGLLSPGLDYFRVKIDGVGPQIGDDPIFLAASEGDGYSAETVRQLAAQVRRPTLVLFEGSAHGTDMFAAQPDLSGRLTTFLKESLTG